MPSLFSLMVPEVRKNSKAVPQVPFCGVVQATPECGEAVIAEQRCVKCGISKPLAEYRPRKELLLKVDRTCKECIREAAAEYKERNRERIAEYCRERYKNKLAHIKSVRARYQSTEAGRKANLRAVAVQKKKSPEKIRARYIFYAAVKGRKIEQLPCSVCGNPKSEGHHHDYSKPLEVTWLCREHHVALHVKLKQKEKEAAPPI